MAHVPPSPCFLLPGPDIGYRLFAPNMLRNVGGLHHVHQRYSPAKPIPNVQRILLTSSRTVTFDKPSHGQLAAVIYEWSDVQYLGKTTSYVDDLPVGDGAKLTAANIDSCIECRTSRKHTSVQQTHWLPATVTSPNSAGSSSTCHRPYLSTRPASGMHALSSAQEMTLLPAAIHRRRQTPPGSSGIALVAIPLPRRTRMSRPGGEPTQIH